MPVSRSIIIALIAIVIVTLGVAAPALAFHSGGVAACSGCHTMHASQDGGPAPGWTPGGNPGLLKYGSATDTCLRCHATRGQMAGGSGYGPGGDFHWLTRTFTWTSPSGAAAVSAGSSHGHNVVSGAYGIEPDALLDTAPGGLFLSNRLGCTSCHDPHGNANFRMLYGSELGPAFGDGQRFTFVANAPLAVGTGGTTLAGGGGDETDTRHTVYKSGMSAWCANCHTTMHVNDGSWFTHPAGVALTGSVADNYNRYVSTADLDGGNAATSYSGLVPFEAVAIDLETVDPAHMTTGPTSADQVMCLSCHRAHASPFADAGRWDFRATFLATDSHPRAGDGGASAQDIANRYYGYRFVSGQRSLCNKCHAKDDGDGPEPGRYPSRRGPYPDNPVGP